MHTGSRTLSLLHYSWTIKPFNDSTRAFLRIGTSLRSFHRADKQERRLPSCAASTSTYLVKGCSKCGQVKPLTQFTRRWEEELVKYRSHCKACVHEERRALQARYNKVNQQQENAEEPLHCRMCGQWKMPDDMARNASEKSGFSGLCKACHAAQARDRYLFKDRVEGAASVEIRCSCCRQTKLASEFHRHAKRWTGRQNICKECRQLR